MFILTCFRVSHALSWKVMKPHMAAIIQEILFPLMCHSDEDQDLWESDPVEYIRVKYGKYSSPKRFTRETKS